MEYVLNHNVENTHRFLTFYSGQPLSFSVVLNVIEKL